MRPFTSTRAGPRALPNKPNERLAETVPGQVRAALAAHGRRRARIPARRGRLAARGPQARRLPTPLTDLHLLHGELPLETQDAALKPAAAGRRKVILATSIAETSLTIEGVRVVIDGGFARVPRFVPRTGFTTLETVPVAPRRRRPAPGPRRPPRARHLLPPLDRGRAPPICPPTARPKSTPPTSAAWCWNWPCGAQLDPNSLRWLDAPPAAAVAQARELLVRLGALERVELRVKSEELRVKN
ncbi:MAG: helicase-related protein [Hymenobacter sp.]